MTDSESLSPAEAIDVRQLALAVRFFFVAIVLGFACLSIRASLAIDGFERIFQDMLGGKPLPLLTVWVIRGKLVLTLVNILVPMVAIGTLFSRRVVTSLYILGLLGFVSIAESFLLFVALFSPLILIVGEMGGDVG